MPERAKVLSREELLSTFGQRLIYDRKHIPIRRIESNKRVAEEDIEELEDSEKYLRVRDIRRNDEHLENVKYFHPSKN